MVTKEWEMCREKLVEEILDEEHALTPDSEKLYAADGNVYRVVWDYHDLDVISDLVLISKY